MAVRLSGVGVCLITACTATPSLDQVLVYDYVGEGEHAVQPAAIPSLTSVSPMRGELGAVTLGGRIREDGVLVWEPGPAVHLPHVLDGDVVVPTDETGLVLTSFYHHLGEVRDDLSLRGWSDDMDAIFPVTSIAWTPEQLVGSELPVENAAYASSGLNTFILYEDGNQVVPLAAHAGVVRHEFGHAWFAQLAPDAAQPGLRSDDELVFEDARAANEGFADIVAVLSLDDPLAIPFSERDPRLEHTSDDYSVSGDPYAFGVVLSAFCWDMRLITGDPADTLVRAVQALTAWNDGVVSGALEGESLSYAITLYDAFEPVVDTAVLCERYRARFPTESSRCAE